MGLEQDVNVINIKYVNIANKLRERGIRKVMGTGMSFWSSK